LLQKLQNILSSKRTVINNFIALGLLQGTNFLIPLIIMPYLTSTIGINGFGLVSFVQVVMIYLSTFTDYGFNVSATREISINKNNKEKINEIFSNVISTKILLSLVAGVILFVLVLFIPKFNDESYAFLLGFSIVLGQTLLPVWFFQGIEQMKYITYLNVVSKVLFTVLIFVFVKLSSDYPLVLIFIGFGNLISGLMGIGLVLYKHKVTYKLPRFSSIKTEIFSGWSLFVANFSIVAYINSNLFILGFFANNTVVGYYSIAEKIVMAMRQPLAIFSQAIYPQICKLATEGHQKILLFFKQLYLPFILLFFTISILVFVYAESIIYILSKEQNNEVTTLLKLLCFVPFVVGLNIPAYQTLLAYNYKKSYTIILTIGSALNILLNLLLAPKIGAIGTAYSVIITEVFITIGLHLILKIRHKKQSLF
jgi:polysaccharide transporter, PST family